MEVDLLTGHRDQLLFGGRLVRAFLGLNSVFIPFALQFFFVLFLLFQFFLPFLKLKIRFCHRFLRIEFNLDSSGKDNFRP